VVQQMGHVNATNAPVHLLYHPAYSL